MPIMLIQSHFSGTSRTHPIYFRSRMETKELKEHHSFDFPLFARTLTSLLDHLTITPLMCCLGVLFRGIDPADELQRK